ncbi:MAG: hypothetical protein HYT87_05815 [Nitrospirae bacterium]|nr:hypothetical protein [Nitrospirota bacterium]
MLRGPKDHPVLVVKKTGRVFSLDPACPPPGFAPATSPACRLEWKPTDQVLACPCDPSATYDAEGRAIASGRPSVIRFRTTLGPNGEVMVDRSVTFDQKDWLKPGAELFLVPPVQAAGGM